jgi:hypothetical protein
MFQTFPHARDFPIAWTLAAAVLSAGASCAPRFDPANARAQFSSKAQSMEGSEPTTADPHPSTNSPAPIAVATTGATTVATNVATNGVVPQVVAPSVAAPAQPEVLVVDSVIIPVPPSLPVESLLHEPADAPVNAVASLRHVAMPHARRPRLCSRLARSHRRAEGRAPCWRSPRACQSGDHWETLTEQQL